MSTDMDANQHIPSLVSICQRVASAHVDSICSLGDGWRYGLIKPILDTCTPETLLRLEQESSYLEKDTAEIWKKLCFQRHPLVAEQYLAEFPDDPESWRDAFYIMRDMEALRLEEVSSRLRTQRQEEAERKKEGQIKYTDKLPPARRARVWGPTMPKTLLQKTRTEAARMQKGIYGMRMVPMPKIKNYSVLPNNTTVQTSTAMRPPPSSSSSSSSSSAQGSHVTVNAVTVRRRAAHSSPARPAPPIFSSMTSKVNVSKPVTPPPPLPTLPQKLSSPAEELAGTPKPPSAKKDPMASLFMPKHRAHSQRPSQASPPRGVRSKA